MTKLHLSISEKIQGDFKPQDLNLMIVFQVNCPGCIASAIPLVQNLYDSANEGLGIVGLSTAFQYYNYNNVENTKRLINEGHLVDHSLSFMKQHGHDKLPYKITFPILMDAKMGSDRIEETAHAILEQHPSYDQLADGEKKAAAMRIVGQLQKQSDAYMTFTINQFRGSPSFVLFNRDYEIIEQWFGHTSQEDINERLARHS